MGSGRIKILLTILLVAAISALGGWLASTQIESPADVAARSAPPTASLILAPVEQRVLSSNIVTRGTARFGLAQVINVAPSPLKTQAGVIAELPVPKKQLREGAVLFSASGRPLFLLRGKFPVYRDLAPGMSGVDVLQLEQGLRRLGYFRGDADKEFDQQTSLALAKWYEAKGWEPFGPTRHQLDNVRVLEQSWGEANKRMLEAKSAETIAALGVESARATARYNDAAAALAVKDQKAARYLIVLDPRQQKTAREAADAKLNLAQADVARTALDGAMAIQAALDEKKLTGFSASLETELVEKLASELKLAKARLGVQLPVDEIVFLPALPVRVKEVLVQVGDQARGPLLTVTNNQLAIDSSLSLSAAPLVKPGMRVIIDEKALGIQATGKVTMIAESPGTLGVDGYHVYFSVGVDKMSAPIDGASLRLTIPVKSTGGAVTVVPVSALSLSADGSSRIQLKTQNGVEYLAVEAGLSADGYVAVVPVAGTLTPHMQVVIGYQRP